VGAAARPRRGAGSLSPRDAAAPTAPRGWTVTLARDVVAGLTVAMVLIPQSLAYAGVAGMPEITGLYAAALPPIAAALFASSPYLQTGPVAMTSLLTFGALAAQAPAGSEEYVDMGVMLALVVGAVRVAVGALRMGVIAHLMSEPLLMGFIPAGAILILSSQLPAALGASGTGDENVLAAAILAVAEPAEWHWPAVALSLVTLGVVFGGRRIHPFFPGVLVALVAAIALGAVGAYDGPQVGEIPAGLPALPDLRLDALPSLLLPGAVIALVGFAEPASIARSFATRERQAWSADREFVSQGVANLAAGLSGGYPVGGSFSRTTLNHMAGAATRASGAVTGLVVLAFLPFASVLEPLPRAVLAAIVITAVLGLIRLRRLVALWRVSKPQFAVAAGTFTLTLVLAPHIERALAVGIALSLVVHLLRELQVEVQASATDTTLEVRPTGVLWFGTAQDLEDRLIALLQAHPHVTRLRLVLDGLGRIDLTGALALDHLIDDARQAGLAVEVVRVPPQARPLLRRFATGKDELK
jgi:SulP family sulfate permease